MNNHPTGDEYRYHVLSEEQNDIIDKAQECLPDSPVDIKTLVRQFGCSYSAEALPWKISGAIHHDNGKYRIYVNSKEPETRQHFTGAHELAHFLLHREHLDSRHRENIMLRSNLSNALEVQANKIAADILMPRFRIDELAETKQYTFDRLAGVFGVSRQALLVRLGIPEYYRFIEGVSN